MKEKPQLVTAGKIVWTIAGSDSSGAAGMQVDLKTFNHLGVHACTVITAVTAQNNHEVNDIDFLTKESIASQISALEKKYPPDALKIGMLGQHDTIDVLQAYLQAYRGHVVLDPLLTSTSGKKLYTMDEVLYLSKLKQIFSFVSMITPNISEAEKIINRPITTYREMECAARDILSLGVKSVLIKGGHFNSTLFSADYWTDGHTSCWLTGRRYANQHYRGTGCVLSSVIAACLALGYVMKDALVLAKMYVSRGIRLATKIDSEHAWLTHGDWPVDEIDLPYLSSEPLYALPLPWPTIVPKRLGLYPIVDSHTWLQCLLPLGVKTIQLRIKNKKGAALAYEVENSIALAKRYQAKLFINDEWRLAIQYGAYGVHLGQDDLNHADIDMIRDAGLRLGISTHCYHEIARAHAINPSYLACGPIYATTSKIMPFAPLGIATLKRFRRTLHYPLVAIGGINLERLPDILSTHVDGVALISAITQAKDAIDATEKLLERIVDYATDTR